MLSSSNKSRDRLLALAGGMAASAGFVYAAKKLFTSTARQFDLRDKIVLITGGSRGLGYALAEEFGRRGARLALCARDGGELQRAYNRLQHDGIAAVPFTADITNPAEVSSLVRQVTGHLGKIDILVNNAGHIKAGPFASFDHADFEYAMNIMFWAPVNLTFEVLPQMQARGEGHIVNITSVGGRVSVPHLLPYSCAKFAFVGFSTGLSAELERNHVRVLTVVPGLMRTGSYLNAEFTGAARDEFAWFGLLGNLPGVSVSARYAARRIRSALETQRRNCVVGLPAKLLISSEALAPETTRTILSFVNRTLLPSSTTQETHRGESLNQSLGKLFQALTILGKKAALTFNERAHSSAQTR